MQVQLYNAEAKETWDQFVRSSKNGTFLFLRDYMEYHRDRFEDHSLLIKDEEGALVALLPANRQQETAVSHGGLTYGGFIIDDGMKLPQVLRIFEATLDYFSKSGFRRLIYKTVPYIYHRVPAEEDRFALFLCNARLLRRGAMAVTAAAQRPPFQNRRTRGARKALQNGVSVAETDNLAAYWEILSERLARAHDAKPVHTLGEIASLRRRFPENIRLFAAFVGNEMLGGVVIHESDRVARAQYIAANERGQELGVLDLIFSELLTRTFATKPYFDFGTSDHEDGRKINRGLVDQKEGYGARMVAHDHYEISIDSWNAAAFHEPLS